MFSRCVILVVLMLLPAFNSIAQLVSPAVTDAYGYKFSQNGTFIDMSIGELAITTIKSSDQVITQGFLQPISIEQPCVEPELVYYPNPVVKELTVAAIDCDVLVDHIETYDLFGKQVLLASSKNNKVDLSPIGTGVYIIRAYAADGQLIGTLKIVKTTV